MFEENKEECHVTKVFSALFQHVSFNIASKMD